MGTRTGVRKCAAFMVALVLGSHLITIAESSKVWGEVPFPEDLEVTKLKPQRYLDDDEDFNADEASGDFNSGEDGSTPEPDSTIEPTTTIYYRAMVNFTGSLIYSPELDDLNSFAFQEISSAVVDTLESDYQRIPGTQMVNVVLVKQIGRDVFVELDVGSDDNRDEAQIREVLYSVVKEGTIGSYTVSVTGFEFRRLGEVVVKPTLQLCGSNQFTCQTDFTCIPLEYLCDKTLNCPDGSDENNCATDAPPPSLPQPQTTPAIKIPSRPGPCRVDQATCQNGECISRDYLCDGDSDCADGSDEFRCGTPSPCEPNEFKCQNGRCALKLWRCDGDDDCEDNSDEMNCPTKKPGDVCAPEQFACLSDDTCIPASYQCDEEPDCPDRSDEYGCAPPTVTSPPEESITAARGQTVTFTCSAVGVPTPIITWRLNWGHIPTSKRITMTSENGHGTLIIRDVKEGDQGAYTCEAINAKGLVFAIPDGVLTLTRTPSNCPDGHFNLGGRCVPCFCFGITKKCQSSGRYRNQISLRFNEEENFKGANVSFPSRPGSPPPLSSTQLLINPEVDEFQLVDLSRRFLDLESYWTLPRQFLGSKVDSYGGFLRYKVSYSLQRDGSEPVEKPDVILRGNGNRLIYRRRSPTVPNVKNHREIKFTEENWQHSSGRQVTREELLTTLANLERINIRTIYDNRMASVGLSDIIMDTTSVEFSLLGHAKDVEECRCPPGYSGLSCESCSSGFERVPGGQYLGTCAGCNCHGHASACDPVSGHCLSCQHNTEGPQCDKCRPGYFGDPKRGRPDDCKPCPCPYTESSRRFSDTCFLDTDGQTTCDACREGYTGRRCERCAYGYVGNPLQPNGQCVLHGNLVTCDNRGTVSSSSRPCTCKANVAGASCEECKPGSFHLSADNPDGCLQCFCMGVTKQCASSTWTREQVRGGINGQLFHLANGENTITNVEGISQRGGSEVVYRSTNDRPEEVYYWVLPENFQGDKVTAYGGVLRYKVRYEPRLPSLVIDNQPDVVIQGNGIFLEHFSQTKPLPRVPATVTVLFRESAWRRADGHPCTREHLLMALADIRVFMIRATYADRMIESSVADIQMDIAVPHSTGNERALEVEECACPAGYRGPSCQECDVGYVRTGSGLYLGTCERCECHGHASHCDPDTGACLQCQHNTAGPRCESCLLGFFGDPVTGGSYACRLCPCLGPPTGEGGTRPCYMDTDGHATCNCAEGHIGRRCERCAPGYTGNPELGQSCTAGGGSCQYCDERGSEGCGSNGVCRCKMNVEGTSCSNCKPGTFHLSRVNKDGCLACFCMGVTQQCSSSPLYRNVIFSDFASRDPQGFALVNRQRTNRIIDDFSVELSTDGSQLSYTKFQQHSQEPHFWQLPSNYQGDKRPSEDVLKHDDEIWKLLTNFSQGPPPPPSFSSSSSSSSSSFSSGASNAVGRSGAHASAPSPPLPPSVLNSPVHASGHRAAAPGRAHHHTMLKDKSRRNSVESSNAAPPGSINEYSLVYKGWSSHPEDVLFWQLPKMFHGDKVSAYGGKLQYTISYVPEARGAPIEDVDVQIIGNDITLVARQDWRRGQASRESRNFEIIFREEFWQRPDGMPATREHLLMVLADLDDVLIRATYHTAMRSSSISSVSMEIAVPTYTGLAQAVEVEQCRCPPGYRGLSCQDCAPGYTRTGGGLYLGHCEPCDCNSHSDSCHPETGVCTNCQHNTMGEQCDQCASGYFGDASAGTPEDCQPCACPDTDPENQFSPTCESLGNGDHRCTACQPGYTGQYCDRCAPGYVGNPQRRERCRPYDAAASLVVRVYPERVKVAQGSSVTLRCQGSGPLPHSFYWTRDDGRPIPSGAERRKQGEELHFSSVKASDAGVYTCTCRNQFYVNRSHAEIIITTSPSKPIEVSIEEPKSRSERPGATASFICTARSRLPAYTIVWTRQGNGKLPDRAVDFNGILTIQNVRPEDAGVYVCTGSNMLGMDEGTAVLHIPDASKAEMFYTAFEMFEGHRQPGEVGKPTVRIHPTTLTIQQGQRAELRCTATGNPAPAVEWTGPGKRISSSAIIRGGVLIFPSVERSDQGDYTCRALNVHGEHAARAVLYVQGTSAGELVKPTVTIHPPALTVRPGQRAEFQCTTTGNPAPTVQWTGGPGNRISSSAIIRGGILIFPSVERSDQGDYTCRALNAHGEHAARAVLYVHGTSGDEVGKPSVTIHPPTLTIQQGRRAEFRCTATGSPTPTVEWTAGPGKRISSSATIRGGVLIFPSVERSDEGDYTCRALNIHGEHAARAVLYVHSASLPHVQVSPQQATIHEGETLRLYCRAGGTPSPGLTWKKRGGSLPPQAIPSYGFHQFKSNSLDALQRRIEELQARMERTDFGTLLIPSVKKSDSGTYLCIGTNDAGSSEAPIEVTVLPGDSESTEVSIYPSVASVAEGGTLELNCNVPGSPSPAVRWTRADRRPLSSNHQIIGTQLRILRASREDSGEYVCRVYIGPDVHQASVSVTVTRPERPGSSEVAIYPPVASVPEGGTLELNCNIPGRPPSSVRWSRADGRPLSSNHQIIGSQLRILRASREDAGDYICRVDEGSNVRQASISVTITRPEHPGSSEVGIYPPVASVPEGGTLELNCNIQGSPSSSVRWSRADGRPLSSNHQTIGTQLQILRASREDAGDYICTLYDGPNVRQASISVTITRPEHPGSSEVGVIPSVASVPEGGTLELNCNIPVSPSSTVRWTRADGRPLSSNHQIIGTQLRILRASQEDAGDYICTVYDGTNVRQATISVTITRPEHPGSSEIGVIPSVASVPEGGTLELNCNIPVSPSSTVRWTRADGRPLSSNHQIIGTQLRILRASREDAGDYICTVYDGTNVRQATISVTITRPEYPGSSEVGVIPSVASVPEGGTLELNCNIPVSPSSTVRWTRADGRPLSSNHQIIGTQLRILRASQEDAGDYICTVYDGTNVRQATISVTITRPERPGSSDVGIYRPVASVVEGGTLELNCNVQGSPSSSVRWSRADGRPLSSNHQTIGTQLRILRASREDAGDYICTVYDGPNVRQASISVTITRPEHPGSSEVGIYPPVASVPEGGTLELNCNIPGSPSSSVRWSRADGHPLSSNHQTIGTQLQILRASREDAGDYICTLYDGPNVRQASISVTITGPEHPGSSEVGIHHSSVTSVEGETLELNCVVSGSPPPLVLWRRADGRPLASNHQVSGTKLRIIQTSQEDSGKYICRISGGPDVLQASVSISSESTHPGSSEVSIYPSATSVVEGELLELTCNVAGDPPPAVVWSRADGRPLSFNHQVVGTQLRILRASPEDAGDYTCRVEGRPHHHNASVSVSISSESVRLKGPIISIDPHRAAVKIGDSARFKCRVHSGAQPIRLQWKLANNRPLPDNVRISPDGSVITITDAQVINQGSYHCLASNPFGMTDSLVSLVVRESPRAIVTPAGPVHVRVGDPINLECQASGEPRPSVTWHRLDNNRRTIMSSPVPVDSTALMQILVARPEDSGTYVCTAQNNQGRMETRVEVIVEGGPQEPTVPRASIREPLMVVVEGGAATLHCDGYGFPKPTITWSKLRSPLPWRHKIVNGSLVLPMVGRQDSGQYICNATNPLGTSEGIVTLEVETPPYIKMLLDDVAVRVGEVIRLQCVAHGTPPLRFEWTKVDGELSTRAEIQEGDLQINLASPSDAGSYKCVAKNNVGQSEAVAKVSVRSPLSVRVSPQVEVKALGSAVEFTCSASGGPEITLVWLKEGGALPNNHHIKDGVLRIENLEKSNEGMYICRASTLFGQAQDSAKLTIQALPKVMINVRTSVQTVMVGTAVEFECQAEGEPVPTLRWSKEGGPLPDYVRVKGGMLRIDRVTDADAGQYRCTATNDVGSVESKVVLNIQSLPQIVAHPETKEVTVGSTAVLPCIASGYPIPTIAWSKQAGELPQKCVQDGHALTIPDVTHEDSGTYVCTASNKQGKVEALTTLKVHERVMPYFSQEPLSYLTLPTIKNSYKEFKISVTFRPDNVDGMILYNGQKRTVGADFISLGLVGGRPEFRFDVGSGMATIRYPTAIKLGEFHTVQLYRNGTKGSIIVDGSAPINGTSQGKFQGLDLNEELFVGGYPNYSMIAKTAELNSGFVGCISQLIIQGEEVIFKDLDRSSTGVTKCPTCKDQPCQNGGVCFDSVASLYKCSCTRGFAGSNCQHKSSQHCHPEACGPDATCINRPSGVGYDCRCHLGKYGHKCMDGILVTTPLFDGDKSYIAYPPLSNIHNDLRIDLEFKPMDIDGLMFFSGGKKMKVEDFVTLSLVDSHVEFRYELGTGQAVLRSLGRVTLDQWHRVTAERLNQDGSLKLNDEPVVRRSSPGKAQGLNIHTPMYLGGVPSMDILPKPANVSMLFDGCIGEVSINGKKVDLSYSFTESKDISQCIDGSPCDRRPCQHGGTCMSTAEYEFQCLCRDGYEGERCEVMKDTCVDSSQCLNGGSCVNGHCSCPAGFTGIYCQQRQEAFGTEEFWSSEGNVVNDSPVLYAAHFHDDGYLTLPNPIFPRSTPTSPETIELEIKTFSSDGLILWEGVEPTATMNLRKLHAHKKLSSPHKQSTQAQGDQRKGKDFISLGVQNGHLVFSYQLGSGEAQIISRERISDGVWHRITAVRSGKQGYVQVDDGAARRGQSLGNSIRADTNGNMYLGGAPDVSTLTGGKFSSGVTGCLRNLSLMNAQPGEQPSRRIDLQLESGVNVQRCTS